MQPFAFDAPEPASYEARKRKDIRTNLLIVLVISLLVTLMRDWETGLGFGIVILIVQNVKSTGREKYFITHLEITAGRISLQYKEREEAKELSGDIQDFRFKIAFAFSRSRIPYLAVYYKGALLLKQFELGAWNEKAFDEVISASRL